MELSVKERKEKGGEILCGFLSEAVLVCLIAGCGLFCAASLFVDNFSMGFFLIFSGAGAFVCWVLSGIKKGTAIGGVCLAAGILVAVVLFRDVFLNGLTGMWNVVSETFGENTEIYFAKYQVLSGESLDRDLGFFLGLLTFVLSVAVYGMLRLRWKLLVLLGAFFVPMLALILGKTIPETGLVLYFSGVLLGEKYMLSAGKRKVLTGNRASMLVFEMCLFGLLFFAVAGVWKAAVPKIKYTEPVFVTAARIRSERAADRIRFKKGEINTLPKGKLSEAGPWKASSETALKVTMEKPDSIYLRGFVGSSYKDSSWKNLSEKVYYENKDLFYWLHKSGFYGNGQLAGIRGLVKDKKMSSETAGISVENTGADSQYLYTPYEMTALPEGFSGKCAFGDAFLKSGQLFGTRAYEFETMGNLVKDFPKLAAKGYLALKKENNSDYRSSESYYNAFVYEQYTELSDSLKNLFKKELGTAGDQKKGHLDYHSAINHIRSYLEKNMTYGEQTEVLADRQDFVKDFLTESKIGYSIHYATAAALMFRYYGIPSRYVEGYLITPEDVKDARAGETIAVSGENGHAWTEIYIDGTGWVPVEMTPKYYGVMEEPDLSIGLEAKGAKVAEPPKEEPQVEEPQEESNLQRVLSIALRQIGKILVFAIGIFDVFCLLFFLWVCICRIWANLRRRRAFACKDNGRATRQLVHYAEQLYQHKNADFSENVENRYQMVYRIGEKAAFSRHGISSEERAQAKECVGQLLKELKKMRGWYDKWIMKYIERLY